MTNRNNRKKRPTGLRYSDLVGAFETVRGIQKNHDMAHDVLERMLCDTEDGLAAGLPFVPPNVPQRYRLDVRERAELMESLTLMSKAFSERAVDAEARAAELTERSSRPGQRAEEGR